MVLKIVEQRRDGSDSSTQLDAIFERLSSGDGGGRMGGRRRSKRGVVDAKKNGE